MGAFEDYWDELKLKEAQRQAQAQADLEDLKLGYQQQQAEIAETSLKGGYAMPFTGATGLTAEEYRQEQAEWQANRPKELQNQVLQESLGKERNLRQVLAGQSNEYYDQARRIAALSQMKFGTDPQFDETIPYDDDVRNETVRDPTTGTVQTRPKPGLNERATRIAEYAKHLQLPEQMVSRKFDEDAYAQLKATEEIESLKGRQVAREEEQRWAPYVEESKILAMARQIGNDEALIREYEMNPNLSQDMIRAVQKARTLQQSRKEKNYGTSIEKWTVDFTKEKFRKFDEAVKQGGGTFEGINIDELIEKGLQPGERPALVTQYLTERAREEAAAQVQIYKNPEYGINEIGNNFTTAQERTQQQVGEAQTRARPLAGGAAGGRTAPWQDPRAGVRLATPGRERGPVQLVPPTPPPADASGLRALIQYGPAGAQVPQEQLPSRRTLRPRTGPAPTPTLRDFLAVNPLEGLSAAPPPNAPPPDHRNLSRELLSVGPDEYERLRQHLTPSQESQAMSRELLSVGPDEYERLRQQLTPSAESQAMSRQLLSVGPEDYDRLLQRLSPSPEGREMSRRLLSVGAEDYDRLRRRFGPSTASQAMSRRLLSLEPEDYARLRRRVGLR